MSASDFLENASLDHELGTAEYVFAAGGRFLALFTADPTDANVAANEVDPAVDDTAYARQPITFASSSGGQADSSSAQTFGAVVYGSGGAAYDVTHIGIYDAVTGGNLLRHKELSVPITRQATKTLVFDAGSIKVTRS